MPQTSPLNWVMIQIFMMLFFYYVNFFMGFNNTFLMVYHINCMEKKWLW